ncbi:hypothetical protein C6P45_002427 [Maudiozyma exigua]|uniref:WSC domain-containing protein n=1 Tax=Maudiozyma exigua TaxID=34358 RepID=A0A9P7B451_MAUEX|nr:hypothetical protein C6P45_002427 [Kazachstania exigua]
MAHGVIFRVRPIKHLSFNNSPTLRYLLQLTVSALIFSNITFAADPYNYKGCYSTSDVSSSLNEQGYYLYQSVNYCEEACDNSVVAALFDGSTCYCSNSASFLNGLTPLSESECSISCNGWPEQICGGASAMNVYINANVDISSSAVETSPQSTDSRLLLAATSSTSSSLSSRRTISSSSRKSTPASTSSSTSTSQSETDLTSTSLSSPSSTVTAASSTRSSKSQQVSTFISIRYTTNVIVQSVVMTSNGPASTVLVTATSIVTSETASSTASGNIDNANNNNKSTNGNHKKLSGGAIAGIVIGVVFGVLFIILFIAILYFIRRRDRKKNDMVIDLSENKQYQPYSYGEEEISPVVVPPTNTLTKNNSKYNPSAKTWGIIKTSRTSSSSASLKSNTYSGNLLNEEPQPTTIIDENKIHSNIRDDPSSSNGNNCNTNNNNYHLGDDNIFEDPVTIYASENIFSATSLQDIGADNRLRIVNPDDPENPAES